MFRSATVAVALLAVLAPIDAQFHGQWINDLTEGISNTVSAAVQPVYSYTQHIPSYAQQVHAAVQPSYNQHGHGYAAVQPAYTQHIPQTKTQHVSPHNQHGYAAVQPGHHVSPHSIGASEYHGHQPQKHSEQPRYVPVKQSQPEPKACGFGCAAAYRPVCAFAADGSSKTFPSSCDYRSHLDCNPGSYERTVEGECAGGMKGHKTHTPQPKNQHVSPHINRDAGEHHRATEHRHSGQTWEQPEQHRSAVQQPGHGHGYHGEETHRPTEHRAHGTRQTWEQPEQHRAAVQQPGHGHGYHGEKPQKPNEHRAAVMHQHWEQPQPKTEGRSAVQQPGHGHGYHGEQPKSHSEHRSAVQQPGHGHGQQYHGHHAAVQQPEKHETMAERRAKVDAIYKKVVDQCKADHGCPTLHGGMCAEKTDGTEEWFSNSCVYKHAKNNCGATDYTGVTRSANGITECKKEATRVAPKREERMSYSAVMPSNYDESFSY